MVNVLLFGVLWFGVLAQCAWSGFVWSVSLGLCFDLIGWLVVLRIAGLVGVLGLASLVLLALFG